MAPNKNAQITALIVKAMQSGMDVRQAIDSVFGEGAYLKIAGALYDELRARAA